MRYKQIAKHARQVARIRAKLGAGNEKIDFIARPYDMKKYLFERRIKKLQWHETKMEQLVFAGLSRKLASYDARKKKNGTKSNNGTRSKRKNG